MVAGLQALKGRAQVSDEELPALIAKRLRRRADVERTEQFSQGVAGKRLTYQTTRGADA